jgi:hypothetical protein
MKNPAAVVFTDAELHRQFKVRCAAEGQAMTAVVQALVRGWLEADAAVATRPVATAKVPGKPRGPIVAAAVSTRCRRCGHDRSAHWVKGCVAGCTCTEGRYLPGDPGNEQSDVA